MADPSGATSSWLAAGARWLSASSHGAVQIDPELLSFRMPRPSTADGIGSGTT